jgi:hypothetical protein
MDLNGRMFERKGMHLVPCDLASAELVESLKEGQRVLIELKKPRHPEHSARFHAICREALRHLEGFQDQEALLDAIKVAVGHVKPVAKLGLVKQPDGSMKYEVVGMDYEPKSIRFEAMDEESFTRFEKRAFYVLSHLLGFDAEELAREAREKNRRNY